MRGQDAQIMVFARFLKKSNLDAVRAATRGPRRGRLARALRADFLDVYNKKLSKQKQVLPGEHRKSTHVESKGRGYECHEN